MTVSTRPKKRHRSTPYEDHKPAFTGITWDDGLLALVDRLDSIRSQAVALRDEHVKSIAEIDGRIALRDKAKRAVARASISLEQNNPAFVPIRVAASPASSITEAGELEIAPTPAVKLLLETEPPEKLIHEQSIIVRAQAINRKNAELARERLPKQPEAQRNKTHHDYFLDEAVWMATDFKEERKLKIALARKVSRMVVQFHAQRQRRIVRAELEAHQRILKLASGVAKEVRKFWSQIGEVAHYRSTLVEEARQMQERRVQLKQLVDQTDVYTKQMARSLHSPSRSALRPTQDIDPESGASGRRTEGVLQATGFLVQNSGRPDPSVDGVNHANSFDRTGNSSEPRGSESSGSEREHGASDAMDIDDESTLVVAEAEEAHDPNEVQTLANQATLSVEELLISQGIDPSAYKADTKDYLSSSEGSTGESANDEDADTGDEKEDDESTIEAAEAEVENDADEGRRLQAENALSVQEILHSQGIDPTAYYADEKDYLKSEPAVPLSIEGAEPCRPDASVTVEAKVPNSEPEDLQGQEGSGRQAGEEDGSSKPPPTNFSKPKVKVPSLLLRGDLRSYQEAGMEWLVSLHKQNLNGILADEMGLGKTIQTIAMLAWLAVEQGVWGPHLIVVPTSVMVNWEVEFKKWLPGFKIVTYFGSMKERKLKRQGWTRPNLFHVCITSYRLAVQDATVLRRKKWVYLILDEAHNIKNFESQRWQTLLSFSSQRRLLITGTPLQNSVMELWSLMHFLTPDIFSSHSEFKGWFSKPLIEAAEAEGERSADRARVVSNLHRVLRPFLLRRLKADVEKGLPPKFEHVIKCRLSKRQRQLYEDFISRNDVKETLQSQNMEGIVSVMIQLKKVCNHPDLFEGRPILSPFSMPSIFYPIPFRIPFLAGRVGGCALNLRLLSLELASAEESWAGGWCSDEAERISAAADIKSCVTELQREEDKLSVEIEDGAASVVAQKRRIAGRRAILSHLVLVNALRIRQRGLLGEDLRSVVTLTPRSLMDSLRMNRAPHAPFLPQSTPNICRTIESVAARAREASERFVCCITKATAPVVEMRYRGDDMLHRVNRQKLMELSSNASAFRSLFRSFEVRSKVTIPDTRLIQWDCGKLQVMAGLLRKLRAQDSRVLIFTQMAKVLDVLESFLNLHSYRYLRLDGTTKAEDRQKLVERFNTDRRVFCMILTTRAGGVGLNLTGANSVIFYDTDYNPAIDNQAQDRAHRIGQTKPVNVYRLVSEQTVEENILKRANEKRILEAAVITSAGFTTDAIAEADLPASMAVSERVVSNDLNAGKKLLPADPDSVKNGLSLGAKGMAPVCKPAELSEKASNTADEVKAAVSQSSTLIKANGVDCSHGKFNGFIDGTLPARGLIGTAQKVESSEKANTQNVDKYQEVTARLLAKEDEREKLALHMAEQEERELRAEFEDSKPDGVGDPESTSSPRKSVLQDYEKVKATLTGIQLYALRVVERWHRAEEDFHEGAVDGNEENKLELPDESNDGVSVHHAVASEEDNGDREEEPGEPTCYELDTTEIGNVNYLKALTDADADIKLYLPLRDGGPEELKVSSVVSGTAAAGLECAEDAAFFPHAYNRMSRTPFATRRQREKGLANLRKRKAEKEAKKQRELQIAAANAAASAAAAAAAAEMPSSTQQAQANHEQPIPGSSISERPKGIKNKLDYSRPGAMPTSKKLKVEVGSKGKAGVSTGSLSNADGVQNSNMGLFRRSTKKNARRLTLPSGKSALASSTSGMPGDGLGVNDGWTTEEDQKLISTASEFNNNMVLVADLLSSDPRVSAGLRRYRSHTHCIDRLINCLGKDKSGPPSAKAASSDADIFRNHQSAMRRVIVRTQERPPSWIIVPPRSVDMHTSHKKAIAQATAKMIKPVGKKAVPPFKAVFNTYDMPKHYRPGFKTTETTPQALSKLRYPFLRPPRDDPRALHQRGAAQPSRYNGAPSGQGPLHRGDPNLFTKTSQKTVRGQQQSSNHRSISQGKSSATARAASAPKVRTDASGSRTVGTVNTPQHPSALPPSLHPSRKGYLVPGTGGRISIGQYGNAVQHIPNAYAYGSVQTKIGGHKPSIGGTTGRVAAPVTSLKPGIRKAPPARVPTPVASLKSDGPTSAPRGPSQSQTKLGNANGMARTNTAGVAQTNGVPTPNPSPVTGGTFTSGKGVQHRTLAGLPPERSAVRSAPQPITAARVAKPSDTNRVTGTDRVAGLSPPAQAVKRSVVSNKNGPAVEAEPPSGANATHSIQARMAVASAASRVADAKSVSAMDGVSRPVTTDLGADTHKVRAEPNLKETGNPTSFPSDAKHVPQPDEAKSKPNTNLDEMRKTITAKNGSAEIAKAPNRVSKPDTEVKKR